MDDYIYQHKKKLAVLAALALILILAISLTHLIIDRVNSATVNIVVAPSIAKVRIGDREYEADGSYKLPPGEYEVFVTAEGFVSKTLYLNLPEDAESDLKLYLEPEDDGNDWYEQHPLDALIVGEVKRDKAIEKVNQLIDANPILKLLPLEIDYFKKGYTERVKYTISYRITEDNTSFVITITDETGGNYADALAKLKSRGADPDKYLIEYADISASYYAAKASDEF